MEDFKRKICRSLMMDVPNTIYASKYICAYDLRKRWQQINHPTHLIGIKAEIDATAFANITMEVINEPFPTPTDNVSARMAAIREWYT